MAKKQDYLNESHFHFNDCDPAGIFYFGNVPNLCHRAYENWLTALTGDWNYWFTNPEWIIPIKNFTVDYMSPMKAGARYVLQLRVAAMSQSSFTTQYHAVHPETKASYFEAQIVHVFVRKTSFTKMPIPETIRPLLETYSGRSE